MFSGLYGDLPDAKNEEKKKQDASAPWSSSNPKSTASMTPRAAVPAAAFVPTSLRAAPATQPTKPGGPQGGRGRGTISAQRPPSSSDRSNNLPAGAASNSQQHDTPSNTAAAATTAAVSLGSSIQDEYDPAQPNDYLEVRKKREQHRLQAEAEAERHERMREIQELEELERKKEEEGKERLGPRGGGGVDSSQQQYNVGGLGSNNDDSSAVPSSSVAGGIKGMGLAQKMMEKMGWKAGQGLGRNQQGISAPLTVQKTDVNAGIIVQAPEPPVPPVPQREQAQHFMHGTAAPPNIQMLNNNNNPPSRVILLENVVGRGDIDENLDEEIGQECSKHGEVSDVLIFEVIEPGFPDDKAVRIFVEFETIRAASAAIAELNGRYFGGRVVSASYYSEEKFRNKDLAPSSAAAAGR